MLSSAELVAFVPTADPDRARRFYEDTLGLALTETTPYALVFRAPNAVLRVTTVASLRPAPHTVLGWSVPDVAAAVQDLRDRGVRFLRYDRLEQDELGVWRAPGGSLVAWFSDPDGNVLSLTQAAGSPGRP